MIRLAKNKTLSYVDLFAGIGGFRYAIESISGLNSECLFSSEIDRFCQKTYENNFGEKPAGDIRERSVKEKILLDLGITFQHGALFDSLQNWENIVFKVKNKEKLTDKDAKELALSIIKRLGLSSEILDLYPSEISGGMQKRVAIARAICGDPKVSGWHFRVVVPERQVEGGGRGEHEGGLHGGDGEGGGPQSDVPWWMRYAGKGAGIGGGVGK